MIPILCSQTTGLWGSPGSNPSRLPPVVVWHAIQSLWRGVGRLPLHPAHP
jgi:hypothetical protein